MIDTANEECKSSINLPSEVTLRKVALRDGFQSLKEFLFTCQKLQIIEALMNAGIKHIEVISFANPKAIPQLRDTADLMAKVPRHNIIYTTIAEQQWQTSFPP